MSCSLVGLFRGAVAACLLATAGCGTIQFQDSSTIRVEQSRFKFWGAPVHGIYLCLSTPPGLPVTLYEGQGEVIGLTRNVVAFHGEQSDNWIRIVYYNGALGWIDGRKIRPYTGPRPNSSCIIPGVDLYQRPIFVIH